MRRLDQFTYYTSGDEEGYLHTHTMDAGVNGEALIVEYTPDKVGNVTAVEDPMGRTTAYAYNTHDEVKTVVTPPVSATVTATYMTTLTYDANGNLVEIERENRDKDGTLQTNEDFTTTLEYTSLNRLKRRVEEAAPGNLVTTDYAYDANGNLALVKTPLAVAGTEPLNVVELAYDERDLLFTRKRGGSSEDARIEQFDYDGIGQVARVRVGAGAQWQDTLYAYDDLDRLELVTDAAGNKTVYVRDTLAQAVSVQRRSAANVLLAEEIRDFDLSGRLEVVNRSHFDQYGNPITAEGGNGSQDTVLVYADTSLVQSVDFEGNLTEYAYDSMNRLFLVEGPEGDQAEYAYDDNSNVTQALEFGATQVPTGDNQTFITEFEYDYHNRPTKRREKITTSTGPAYNDTVYAYDSLDNLVLVEDSLGETVYAFDGLGRQTGMTRMGSGGFSVETGTGYDANSRVVSRTDALGQVTQYGYDALDQLVGEIFADGTTRGLDRDVFGNVVGLAEPSGREVVQNYDALNRLTGRTVVNYAGFGVVGTETFGYDGLSRPVSAQDGDSLVTWAYDSLGNVLSESLRIDGGATRTLAHGVDNRGNRRASAYPGGRTLAFDYDDADRLATIMEGTDTLAAYLYAGPRVMRRSYHNDTMSLDLSYSGEDGAPNAAGDLGFGRIARTKHSLSSGGTVLDERTYQWDALGNKTQRAALTPSGGTFDFAYDPLSRLVQSTDGTATLDYLLDDAGNRESVDDGSSVETYTLDAAMNQYLATPFDLDVLHDAEGNLSSIDTRAKVFTYDAHDRLTGYLTAAPRTLDAFGANGDVCVNDCDYEGYQQLLGTWAIVDGALTQTDAGMAGGRILRTLDAGTERFAFSYIAHGPADPENTYAPEYYALALLRVDDSASPEWRYIALVIQPDGMALREWVDDELLGYTAPITLASDPAAATEPETWYEVEVRYGAGYLEVFRAKRGNPFPASATLTLTDLTVTSGSKVGFGVGTGTEFAFDNFITSDAAVDLLQTTFQYDALGRRIARHEYTNGALDGSVYYYYDGDRVIEERNGTASGSSTLATYVYGNYVDEVLQMQRGGNTYYYHADDLFNVTALTSPSGAVVERYDYADFGQPSITDGSGTPLATSAIGNPYAFNGQRYDQDLGLYHYRARYLDPRTGRFLQRDPIGVWGDGANLGNGYAYGGNNPWSVVDPYGKWGISFFSADLNIGIGETSLVLLGPDYFAGAIQGGVSGIKGILWTGPKEFVTGLYGMVRHPAQTGKGLYAFGEALVTEPGAMAGKAWEGVKSLPSNPEQIGALTFDVMATVATAGASKASLAPKAGRVVAVADEAADVSAVATKVAAPRTLQGVQAYEVGTADALRARSLIGDAIDIHHVGQARPFEQLVPGYSRATGPAIAIPEEIHRAIPMLRGATKLSPRQVLAYDIWNLRKYTDAPNSSLQRLIELNKQMYPGTFRK